MTFTAEIQKLRKRYPDPPSAVMPALRLAQAENGGWLSPSTIREVAEALELTPAYCLSIASFYDQYYLEPGGRTRVEVCTNVSCGLAGAQQVLEAFEHELGVPPGLDIGGRRVHPRTIECLGGCGWATVVAIDNRHRLPRSGRRRARNRRGAPQCLSTGRSSSRAPTAARSRTSATTCGQAAFRHCARRARWHQTTSSPSSDASGLRGRGGAGFPTGRKWAFVPKPDQLAKPHYLVVNADESEPGTFKDREIMLRVPFRFLEGCLISAHGIQSQHVFIYIRGEYEGEFEILRDSLEAMRKAISSESHRRRPPRRRRLHLRRGDGAPRVARGQAGPAADEAAVPRDRRPVCRADRGEQHRVDHHGDAACSSSEARSTRSSASRTPRARGSSRSRVTSEPRQLRAAARDLVRELIYDVGGGVPDGRELKAIIPGGSSTSVLTADDIDMKMDFTSLVEAGSSIGSAGVIVIDDRCCMVQLGIRVSQFYEHESCGKCTPCRVGTRWVTQILQKIEAGRAEQADLDLLLSVCDRILGKCLCPLGDSDAIAVFELRRPLPRRVPGAHRPRPLPLRRRVLARGHPCAGAMHERHDGSR